MRTSLALFKNRWYVIGILIAIGSWGFHVAALALAPISIVQAVIAGGLVLLTVVADRLFAHSVTRRSGSASDSRRSDSPSSPPRSRLRQWRPLRLRRRGPVDVPGGGGGARDRRRVAGNDSKHMGVALGASAGLFWAVSDTAIKAQTSTFGENVVTVFVHPLVLVIIVASFVGLTVSAKSLQTGKAVPVIAMTTVAANALTIAAGPIVFGDPVPDDALGRIARVLAFVLVIGAAALTPAPVRAAEAEAKA